MPDYFSHAICAQSIYEMSKRSVREAIDDFTLYLLGAQGGDVFFAYKLNFKKDNLGRRLHAADAYELITLLRQTNISYAAGFATHYALDCTLHPAIYAFEKTSKSPLSHARFEGDLGLFVSRKLSCPRKILPRERVMGSTFTLYDCIKRFEPEVTVTGVERCLKRHFSYTRALFKSKRPSYAFNYDYASLSGAVDDALALGAACVEEVVDGAMSRERFSKSFLEK